MMQTREDEIQEKLDRLRTWMRANGVDGVSFGSQPHVSWLTAGLENVIERSIEPGLVRALVTVEAAYLVTQNIEAPRLIAEEGVEDLGFEVRAFPWHDAAWDDVICSICPAERLASDGVGAGRDARTPLRDLRLALTAGERERLAKLAADATGAVEGVLRRIEPGTTGRAIAAELARALELAGIVPAVLLVGGDQRKLDFRHPTVNDGSIHDTGFAVLVGSRGGLHVALTRSVSFGALGDELAERHRVAATVEAEMMMASAEGATYGDALAAGVAAYERLGYRGEWEHHYQGGPIGYHIRELAPGPPAAPNADSAVIVRRHQAVAWNPTVQGTKSEDTFLVTDGAPHVLTASASWPVLDVEAAGVTLQRPSTLER